MLNFFLWGHGLFLYFLRSLTIQVLFLFLIFIQTHFKPAHFLPIFLNCIVSLLFSERHCVCDINIVSNTLLANIISCFVGWPLLSVLWCTKVLHLIKSSIHFCFCFCCHIQEIYYQIQCPEVPPFNTNSFIILALRFRYCSIWFYFCI